jgi:septal ring factor EnvC (AmiA/AmiB activator)
VCDLREKRLDQEDVLAELQKAIDLFKKEHDLLSKKQKTVELGLKKIDEEIAQFQKEKQNKLNDIDVMITLKMHQMEYLVNGATLNTQLSIPHASPSSLLARSPFLTDQATQCMVCLNSFSRCHTHSLSLTVLSLSLSRAGKLPADMSEALVFSNAALARLRARIQELLTERSDLKRRQKELKREHIQLHRDRKDKEARIAELEGCVLLFLLGCVRCGQSLCSDACSDGGYYFDTMAGARWTSRCSSSDNRSTWTYWIVWVLAKTWRSSRRR